MGDQELWSALIRAMNVTMPESGLGDAFHRAVMKELNDTASSTTYHLDASFQQTLVHRRRLDDSSGTTLYELSCIHRRPLSTIRNFATAYAWHDWEETELAVVIENGILGSSFESACECIASVVNFTLEIDPIYPTLAPTSRAPTATSVPTPALLDGIGSGGAQSLLASTTLVLAVGTGCCLVVLVIAMIARRRQNNKRLNNVPLAVSIHNMDSAHVVVAAADSTSPDKDAGGDTGTRGSWRTRSRGSSTVHIRCSSEGVIGEDRTSPVNENTMVRRDQSGSGVRHFEHGVDEVAPEERKDSPIPDVVDLDALVAANHRNMLNKSLSFTNYSSFSSLTTSKDPFEPQRDDESRASQTSSQRADDVNSSDWQVVVKDLDELHDTKSTNQHQLSLGATPGFSVDLESASAPELMLSFETLRRRTKDFESKDSTNETISQVVKSMSAQSRDDDPQGWRQRTQTMRTVNLDNGEVTTSKLEDGTLTLTRTHYTRSKLLPIRTQSDVQAWNTGCTSDRNQQPLLISPLRCTNAVVEMEGEAQAPSERPTHVLRRADSRPRLHAPGSRSRPRSDTSPMKRRDMEERMSRLSGDTEWMSDKASMRDSEELWSSRSQSSGLVQQGHRRKRGARSKSSQRRIIISIDVDDHNDPEVDLEEGDCT